MHKIADTCGNVFNTTNLSMNLKKNKDSNNLYLSRLCQRRLVFLLFLLSLSIIWLSKKLWLSNDEITKTPDTNVTEHFSAEETEKISPALKCYRLPQEDEEVLVLPDYEVKPNSIFFVETSCRHVDGITLSQRQACAYESAARAHLDSEVLVVFPSPISLKNPSALVSKLLKYPNLKLVHIDLKRFSVDTPLENFDIPKRLAGGCCPFAHTADILRLLILWKYGGTYLDSDFLVLRPVNKMENYAGIEFLGSINNAILNINISSEGGRAMIDSFLSELRATYRKGRWAYNGPRLLTRVLKRKCNEKNVAQMTPEKCKGFTVFPSPPESPFYPMGPENWRRLFEDKITEDMISIIGQKWAIHMYNSQNRGYPVKKGSKMLYNVMASWFCPEVYSVMSDPF